MLQLQKINKLGKLIVFEGTDGAGKTTLITMTQSYLSERYGEENVIVVKQPTELARKTRLFQKMMYSAEKKDINYRAVQLLTLSDRVQHNTEVIVPALQQGKIVICDRYIYTSVANMLARGFTHESWFFHACREIVAPDVAFLAYIQPKSAIERIKSRPEERERFLDEELLKRVAENFLKYSRKWGLHVVKTDRDASLAFIEVRKKLEQLWRNDDAKNGIGLCCKRFAGKRN